MLPATTKFNISTHIRSATLHQQTSIDAGDNLSNFVSTSSTEDPVRDVEIVRGKGGYGINFRGIKSFDHSLNKHVYQHIIMVCRGGFLVVLWSLKSNFYNISINLIFPNINTKTAC